MKGEGTCEHCFKQFSYELYHAGFGEFAFAYCDHCGGAALMSYWNSWPKGLPYNQGSIAPEVEPHLRSCRCGGRFRIGAAPRCPHCEKVLSADTATAYIEANARGTPAGWRWQHSWTGYYVVVVADRRTNDPWMLPK